MKKLFATFLLITLLRVEVVSDYIENLGDSLLLLIPSLTFGYSYFQGDECGEREFIKSILSTTISVYALKYSVDEQRPNHKDYRSFPSGHAALTMSSAFYLHKRYDLQSALPAYIGSLFTAYSRVESDNHYLHDVVIGALIGAGCSYYFTTNYKGISLKPIYSADGLGLGIFKRW